MTMIAKKVHHSLKYALNSTIWEGDVTPQTP